MDRIICVAGPTASGKTALAVSLAELTNGEVISCDSMQFYRGMDIGTAKPTAEEMRGIPHHMIDCADPCENFSVSRYCDEASAVIDRILENGHTAVVAGGTGLYMDALISGRSFAASPAPGMREALEQEADRTGMEAMLEQLREIDPEAAGRLHVSDRKRILRALEVYRQTGETITAHNLKTQSVPPRYDACWLAIDFADRADLYARINRRVDIMLQRGLLDEIRCLLEAGVPQDCTALQAIGYKEFIGALKGECTVDEAAEQVKQSSRRYAKRQLTWFRRNPRINWLIRNADSTDADVTALAVNSLQACGFPFVRLQPYMNF